MRDNTPGVPPQTPSPESSVGFWYADGDADLTKNTKERLAYYEALGRRAKEKERGSRLARPSSA
jgi:hypothetical protein